MRRIINALIAGFAALAAWVWTPSLAPSERNLRVTFLDVGQGDSTVIESPGGATIVVDAGRPFEDGDSGRQIVLPYLRSRGINRIHGLVLTHADDDHIGGAETLLNRIRVDRALIPAGEREAEGFRSILRTTAEKRIPVIELYAGQVIDLADGTKIEVLNPLNGDGFGEKDNDRSIVLRILKGRTSLLLPGDAEEAAESWIMRQSPAMTADILKAAHHGSRTSTSERFLRAVRPQMVVISAGKGNSFGHPHRVVLERCARRGIRVLRTDAHGGITVESDGALLTVATERAAR